MLNPEKRTKMTFITAGVFRLLFVTISILMPAVAGGDSIGDIFGPLKEKLIQDGLDRRQVAMAFSPPPPPMFATVSKTLRMREGRLNYSQFLTPASLEKARAFQRIHDRALRDAEIQYGVDSSVIVAILLVETQLGGYTGQVPTLAVLSTFVLMDQKEFRDRIWSLLPARDRKRWDRSAFDDKLNRRSQWAYGEVRALLEVSRNEGKRVDTYKGSVMGAGGGPQFLPASLLKCGGAGDRDGRIDLSTPHDTISSVANYLRGHGWTEARNETDREEVIYTYNKSRPYVRTILEIASRLGALPST